MRTSGLSIHDPEDHLLSELLDPRIDLHQLSEHWRHLAFPALDMPDNSRNSRQPGHPSNQQQSQSPTPVDLEDAALLAQFAAAMQGQDTREASAAFLRNLLHSQPQNVQYPPYVIHQPVLTSSAIPPPWPIHPHPYDPHHLPFGAGPQYPQTILPPINTLPEAGPSSQSSLPPAPSPSNNIDPEDVVAITEDKRRRNTAASARFRIKKKLRTLNLERSVSDLTGRAEELEREAADLRRENGWLKEIIMLKGSRLDLTPDMLATSTAELARGSSSGAGGRRSRDESEGEEDDHSSDDDYRDGGKGKGRSSKGKSRK